MKKLTFIILILLIPYFLLSENETVENGNDYYNDMLTPVYYNADDDSEFRKALDEFIEHARKLPFQNPLQNEDNELPAYRMGRGFGDAIGPGGTGSHHPAFDYYIENAGEKIKLFAAIDGIVKIDSLTSRYRHSLSITTDVTDGNGKILGKIKVIYAHIDLDLDAADNIDIDGKHVKKGDVVSSNLYSGTRGGPHLHFEIRYYRGTDTAEEEFYGGRVGSNTEPSAGSWEFGYWDPDKGYGFAHPLNHIDQVITGNLHDLKEYKIDCYPNPVNNFLTVSSIKYFNCIKIIDVNGSVVYNKVFDDTHATTVDFKNYKMGLYIVRIEDDDRFYIFKIMKRT